MAGTRPNPDSEQMSFIKIPEKLTEIYFLTTIQTDYLLDKRLLGLVLLRGTTGYRKNRTYKTFQMNVADYYNKKKNTRTL